MDLNDESVNHLMISQPAAQTKQTPRSWFRGVARAHLQREAGVLRGGASRRPGEGEGAQVPGDAALHHGDGGLEESAAGVRCGAHVRCQHTLGNGPAHAVHHDRVTATMATIVPIAKMVRRHVRSEVITVASLGFIS